MGILVHLGLWEALRALLWPWMHWVYALLVTMLDVGSVGRNLWAAQRNETYLEQEKQSLEGFRHRRKVDYSVSKEAQCY